MNCTEPARSITEREMDSSKSKSLGTESSAPSSSPIFDGWKEHLLAPTLLAGTVGGGYGSVSKHRKVHGLANISATYATNFAIVTGFYCGAREFVRVSRHSQHDDLMNSAIAGFGSGALLGRLQGGQLGAIRYSLIFAVAGTTMDYTALKIKPLLKSFGESARAKRDSLQKSGDWLKLPEWSPIQVLDEEALAAKQAREQKLRSQVELGKLTKES